jgi:hypothetical protein
MDFGADLRTRAPVIDLVVRGLPAAAEAFFDRPALQGIRSLRFEGMPLSLLQVRALAASPFLRRLAWLDLAYMRLPPAAVEVLCASGLSALRYARLDGNAFPDVNPTLDEQDGVIYGVLPSNEAERVRRQHGDRAWLHGHPPERAPVPEAVG